MRYGLVGERLTYSFSKEIHERLAPYSYELCEIERDKLADFMEKRDFLGLNVTIPYKSAVIPYLDEVSDKARELCSVNTVVNRGGRLFGYNTDYMGLRETVERSEIDLDNKKILIFGSGATARVARSVCADLGAREIYLVSREIKSGAISYAEAYGIHNDADVIINTTPVGTYPDSSNLSVDIDRFSRPTAFFDAVYNPPRTAAALSARRRGIYAECGLYMLTSQAAYASAIFGEREKPTREEIEKIYLEVLREKENIVLTGMPCAGKTTVGRLLAENIGRNFVDIDEEIEKTVGCTIAELFERCGEGEFRRIESETVRKFSHLRSSVIATGGGTILRADNVDALRSSGRIFFIDRSPSRLIPTESRPLARTRIDVERLYRARYGTYVASSDVRINGDCSPETVASLIWEEFNK